jgi:CheY-like chemotaxis protein
MDISCPRCGKVAEPAGHEDARAFFRCPTCERIWAVHVTALSDPSSTSGPAPRVLVADDSPEMLGLLSAWLEDEGCIVIAVGTGRAALDAARSHTPDVAFLDVILPQPDGFRVCELLARREGMPVVLMTGMANPDMERAKDVGALVLLRKPFPREVVTDALARALEHRRAGGAGFIAAAG